MENIPAEIAEEPRRRRRSHKKSSKATFQRRRRIKQIGFWLVGGLVGGLIVTGIAILAGGASQ
jgi:hypothetical protein